jgi:hypothetical protein
MPEIRSLDRLENDVELWRLPRGAAGGPTDLFMVRDPTRSHAEWGPMARDEAEAMFEERVQNAHRR